MTGTTITTLPPCLVRARWVQRRRGSCPDSISNAARKPRAGQMPFKSAKGRWLTVSEREDEHNQARMDWAMQRSPL